MSRRAIRRLLPFVEALPGRLAPASILAYHLAPLVVTLTADTWGGAGSAGTWIDPKGDPLDTPGPTSVAG